MEDASGEGAVQVVRRSTNALGEWRSCCSWKRFYVALNEWLDPAEFCKLLLEFYSDLGLEVHVEDDDGAEVDPAAEMLRTWMRDGERWYQAFLELHDALDPDGVAWIEWVRERFPEPPGDFEAIGRIKNRPFGEPGESPRMLPLPVHHAYPDDDAGW